MRKEIHFCYEHENKRQFQLPQAFKAVLNRLKNVVPERPILIDYNINLFGIEGKGNRVVMTIGTVPVNIMLHLLVELFREVKSIVVSLVSPRHWLSHLKTHGTPAGRSRVLNNEQVYDWGYHLRHEEASSAHTRDP